MKLKLYRWGRTVLGTTPAETLGAVAIIRCDVGGSRPNWSVCNVERIGGRLEFVTVADYQTLRDARRHVAGSR
jgi:hypothetical protein